MSSTVNSYIHLEHVDIARLHSAFSHLKSIEDLPYYSYDIQISNGSSVDMVIRYPLKVFDGSVTQFLAVLFGELSLLKDFPSIRFEWLEVPEAVFGWFGGPKHGATEVARRFGALHSPLLMAIIKPSLGERLSMTYIRNNVLSVLDAGFNAVKDDEMQGNLRMSSIEDRLTFARECHRYVPCINMDAAHRYSNIITDPNIGMILVNGSLIGYPMLHEISRNVTTPILSHLAFYGIFMHSFSNRLLAFLHRLFGADAFITPIGGIGYYSISRPAQSQIIEALVHPLPIRETMPLLTGGARLDNLKEILLSRSPYPYGVVFGTQLFASSGTPGEMAKKVKERMKSILGKQQ